MEILQDRAMVGSCALIQWAGPEIRYLNLALKGPDQGDRPPKKSKKAAANSGPLTHRAPYGLVKEHTLEP